MNASHKAGTYREFVVLAVINTYFAKSLHYVICITTLLVKLAELKIHIKLSWYSSVFWYFLPSCSILTVKAFSGTTYVPELLIYICLNSRFKNISQPCAFIFKKVDEERLKMLRHLMMFKFSFRYMIQDCIYNEQHRFRAKSDREIRKE